MIKNLPASTWLALARVEPLKKWVSRHAKLLAVLFGAGLTLPRLLTLLSGPQDGKNIWLDFSWMISLPTTLDQNEWLGRDIFFSYGPLAQFLTWFGKSLNTGGSAFDGFAFIGLLWRVLGLILFSSALLLIKQIDWKLTLLIFLLSTVQF